MYMIPFKWTHDGITFAHIPYIDSVYFCVTNGDINRIPQIEPGSHVSNQTRTRCQVESPHTTYSDSTQNLGEII